ncbi:hypothetical protein DPEC_G00335820 [Dallia pectoralis]|uniref:Uncharacterized protein n=1 Tax=Dallia pectoralis TaxID=75939 RepID=A0ACC2F7A4_DALPE|nr:hypothetical protein DPEC_G00335820 [Dallia pectoralis]
MGRDKDRGRRETRSEALTRAGCSLRFTEAVIMEKMAELKPSLFPTVELLKALLWVRGTSRHSEVVFLHLTSTLSPTHPRGLVPYIVSPISSVGEMKTLEFRTCVALGYCT